MFASVAENRHEEIGGAIGHKVLFHEIRRGSHEGSNLHNPLDAAKVTKSSLCLGKDVDSTGACSSLSVRNRQLITNLPRVHKLAAFQRKLARCEKQRTALCKRNVVCGGCCGLWDGYTQILRRLSIVSVIVLILACKGTSRSTYRQNR